MSVGKGVEFVLSESRNFVMMSPSNLFDALMFGQPFVFSTLMQIELTMFWPTVFSSIEIHSTGSVQISDIVLGEASPFQMAFVSEVLVLNTL